MNESLCHDMNEPLHVAEVFRSVQGEGALVGTSAVFVRLAGCNMSCQWCDTDHSQTMLLTPEQLAQLVAKTSDKPRRVIWTGGEPMMQAHGLTLTAILLKEQGYEFHAIETNGSIAVPGTLRHVVDPWLTVSPKSKKVQVTECDELKVLVGNDLPFSPGDFAHVLARHRFVQPLWVPDTCAVMKGDAGMNVALEQCMAWLISHPHWRLSVQMHKLIGVQ